MRRIAALLRVPMTSLIAVMVSVSPSSLDVMVSPTVLMAATNKIARVHSVTTVAFSAPMAHALSQAASVTGMRIAQTAMMSRTAQGKHASPMRSANSVSAAPMKSVKRVSVMPFSSPFVV